MTPQRLNQRNSSVELFRIIATFLVLIVHFNGWFVGGMPERLSEFSSFRIGQAIIESFADTCVNCFLVITGWYGLKFKWRHVWTIWSVLVWIYVPFYLIEAIYSGDFSVISLLMKFIAIGQESYYVQCYLMLLFLSPILNAFITKFGKNILPYTLAFWAIEIVFDWILRNKCLSFGHGYELTHFVLMYILGQTAYLYRDTISQWFSILKGTILYLMGVFLIICIYLFIPAEITFAYSNPINVVMAFTLFLIFEKYTFYNKAINFIASSTLTVYILHCTPPVFNYLCDWDNEILASYSYPVYLLIMAATILIVFVSCVLYDKIRMLFMPKLGYIVCSYLDKYTSKYISLIK